MNSTGLRPCCVGPSSSPPQDDCAPFPGVYQLAACAVGGSLAAAEALACRRTRLAIHLDGGRHHAHKSAAAGFCFLNDVVLAILQLLGSFNRVMYVDVDVHHCDAGACGWVWCMLLAAHAPRRGQALLCPCAPPPSPWSARASAAPAGRYASRHFSHLPHFAVEDAFQLTERVLTLSLHKRARGFFPGGGSHEHQGAGAGAGFSLNLPLADGLRDGLFLEAFSRLAGGAAAVFCPDCVVLQCGVDGLAHDPVAASWGLTPAAYAGVAGAAASWGVPLMVLGGGGYSSPDAARAWAAAVASLHGRTLPIDVPEHDNLDRYGPSFTFEVHELLGPDINDRCQVLRMCDTLLAALRLGLCRGGGSGGGSAVGDGTKRQKRIIPQEAVT